VVPELNPLVRPRRLRVNPVMRAMVAETAVEPRQLINLILPRTSQSGSWWLRVERSGASRRLQMFFINNQLKNYQLRGLFCDPQNRPCFKLVRRSSGFLDDFYDCAWV